METALQEYEKNINAADGNDISIKIVLLQQLGVSYYMINEKEKGKQYFQEYLPMIYKGIEDNKLKNEIEQFFDNYVTI